MRLTGYSEDDQYEYQSSSLDLSQVQVGAGESREEEEEDAGVGRERDTADGFVFTYYGVSENMLLGRLGSLVYDS